MFYKIECLTGEVQYDFLLIPDKKMEKMHQWVKEEYLYFWDMKYEKWDI